MKKNESATPVAEKTEEQNTATAELNAEQAPPAAEPTIDELKAAAVAASVLHTTVFSDPKSTDDQIFEAQMKAYAATTAWKNAVKKLEADKLAVAFEEKLNNAKDVIAQAFGVTRETLDGILNVKPATDGTPNPLAVAIQTVFGKPIVYAKQGQTGKSLVASLHNGDVPSNGGAGDELIQLMKQGKTNAEIEAMFPDRYPRNSETGLVHGTIRSARWKFNKSQKG